VFLVGQRYKFSLTGLIFFGLPPPQEQVERGGSVITLLGVALIPRPPLLSAIQPVNKFYLLVGSKLVNRFKTCEILCHRTCRF